MDEIRVRVRGGYLRAMPAEDPLYPGIWVEFIRDGGIDDEAASRPQLLVEQPDFYKEGKARVLIWEDRDNEDFTLEIDLDRG